MDTTVTGIIISLLTLTLLEVVLGVDNLIFISIISSRLPQYQQKKARRFGLVLAWVTRLLLLATAVWIAKMTKPFMQIGDFALSARDLFLIAGGLFLLFKATHEIHLEIESDEEEFAPAQKKGRFWHIIFQIALMDIIFSLDSVITAIGLTQIFWVMAVAITITVLLMIFASEPLSRFVLAHPTVKMLALSFLIVIGMALLADGMHFHVPRGYIYFSLGFSLLVESLNLWRQKKRSARKKRRKAGPQG